MIFKIFQDPCIFQFYWFQNFKWKIRIRTLLLPQSKDRNIKNIKNVQTLFELVVTLLPTETKNPESLTFCDDMVAAASQQASNYIMQILMKEDIINTLLSFWCWSQHDKLWIMISGYFKSILIESKERSKQKMYDKNKNNRR